MCGNLAGNINLKHVDVFLKLSFSEINNFINLLTYLLFYDHNCI